MKPNTPAACSGARSAVLPGIAPPHRPVSTNSWPSVAFRLASRPSTVVVGGIEFSGMSTMVVTPPAAAARVALAKPSQSVRPGSFTWTWLSTRPGSSASPARSVTSPSTAAPYGRTSVTRPSRTTTSAGRSPSGRTARRERNTVYGEPVNRTSGLDRRGPRGAGTVRLGKPHTGCGRNSRAVSVGRA